MKTAELIGPALDWAVAKCEGRDWPDNAAKFLGEQYYNPSTDWSHGGPISERELLAVYHMPGGVGGNWRAERPSLYMQAGPTPLIAAMRVYVASKLGDEVEIPEELK